MTGDSRSTAFAVKTACALLQIHAWLALGTPQIPHEDSMHRTAVALGAFILIAAPFAPRELPALFDQLTLHAELEDLAGGIQGLSAAHVRFDPSRQEVMIDGLVLHRSDIALRIRHLVLRLSAPQPFLASHGFMQAAAATGFSQTGNVSADDITVETAALHAVIKHIDMESTRLTKADLTALFDTHAPGSPAERLAKLSAAHVAISEIMLRSKAAAQDKMAGETNDEKIVFRDIAMDDLVQGHAGLVVIGATSIVTNSPDTAEMQTAFGPMRLTGLDLVQAAALVAGSTTKTQSQQKLCDSLTVEGVRISAAKTQTEMGLATLAIKDVKAGASRVRTKPSDKPTVGRSAAERATAMTSFLDGFDIGSLEFTDLRYVTKTGTTPWTGRIGHGFLTRLIAAKIAEAGFENFTVKAEGATVKIGRLNWHGLDLGAPQADATALADHQKITADALDIDLAGISALRAHGDRPTHFVLKHLELASSNMVEGVPTHMTATFDHFVFDVDGIKAGDWSQIATLGYGKFDLSSRLEAHFAKDNREFGLDALSVSGVDMGSVRVSAHFDHVAKALFSSNQADMEMGLLSLLLRHIEVKVENTGLFQRLVAAAAKKAGTSPAEVRKKLTDAATSALPALLGNGPATTTISAALTKFIAEPKTFRFAMTAPDGIGALDVALLKDPAMLLQKVEIEATADQ